MTIYIGADHRGFELKNQIKNWLIENNHHIEDIGAFEKTQNDDYTDYAVEVGKKVTSSPENRGIVICGSGAGMDIASNKIKGVRCTIGFNIEQVKASRNDDNLNVLAISSDFTLFDDAKALVDIFLTTPYNPTDNHARRLDKINALEIH